MCSKGECVNGRLRGLFSGIRRRTSGLKTDPIPQAIVCCHPPFEKLPSCNLTSVMDPDACARPPKSSEIPIPVSNACVTTNTSSTLPVRSPTAKILTGCVPIQGLRRSASSPRHSLRTTVPLANSTARSGNQDSPNPRSDQNKQPTSDANPKENSDLWETEGSFKWRRIRPSATFHHTTFGSFKAHSFWNRHKYTASTCESADTSNVHSPLAAPAADANSVFRDPMLEELDAELPVPPPPPRAYPPWLKSALAKQQKQQQQQLQRVQSSDQTSHSLDYPSPLSDITRSQISSDQHSSISATRSPGLDKQKSFSLEHNPYGIRIYPVMQDGVKISDTHYWLLDPPQSLSIRPRCPSAETADGGSPPEASEYLNVPPGVILHREVCEPNRQALNNMHYHMVQRLMQDVPEATEAECQAVLIGAGYFYEEARKRLKFELLRRLGHFTRSFYKRVLHNVDWDLPRAMNKVRAAIELQNSRDLQLAEVVANRMSATPSTLSGASHGSSRISDSTLDVPRSPTLTAPVSHLPNYSCFPASPHTSPSDIGDTRCTSQYVSTKPS